MGNFSRDSFRATNALNNLLELPAAPVADPRQYVSVRLQQGVPLLDADVNELDDIRRIEQRALAGRFIGDGVPVGSDGFRIFVHADDNDLSIEAGSILVGGVLAWNPARTGYATQPNFALQRQTPPLPELPALPALSPPASGEGTRHDLVVLDVWEREVGSAEDGRIADARVGVETSVRLLREWVVRVVEDVDADATEVPDSLRATLPGHLLYPLARIERPEGKDRIETDDITDLRRTDLTLARGEGALRVYGPTGVLSYDTDDFANMCRSAWTAYDELLRSDLFLNDALDDVTAVEAVVLTAAFQDVKLECRLGEHAARRRGLGNRRGLERLDGLERVQERFHDRLRPLAEASTGRVLTAQFLDQYRLLLGEEPGQPTRGLRHALDDGRLREAIDAQLAINGFLAGRATVLPRGRIVIGFREGPPSDEPVTAPGTYRYVYDVTSRLTLPDTLDIDARVDGAGDWTASVRDTLSLAPDEATGVPVDVEIPDDTPSTAGTLVLHIRSRSNPGEIDVSNNEVDIALNALPAEPVPINLRLVSPAIDVATETIAVGRGVPAGLPGHRVPAQFNVTNEADASRAFTVSFAYSSPGVFEPLSDRALTIAAGDTESVDAVLEATDSATDDTRADLVVTVTRDDDPSLSTDLIVMLVVDTGTS